MSVKQDLQGVRTASQLEQKYQFGKRFAEVFGIATDARTAAEEAKGMVGKLDENLTHDEIFNRLTDNGKYQAIYRENGNIYINASFLKAGYISSDMIKAGVIRSTDYEIVEVDYIYPSDALYPDVDLYPNNGEDIQKGIEIDFAAGVIRGVLTSPFLDELAERVNELDEEKAPAGYGLGGTGVQILDCNDATMNGFYWPDGSNGATNVPSAHTNMKYGCMITFRRPGAVAQLLSYENLLALRYNGNGYSDDTWGEWEYVNPPMVAGVGYRTTGRHNNKVKYKMLVDCGALPNTTSKSVSTSIPSDATIVSAIGVAVNTSGAAQPLPVRNTSGVAQCMFFITSGRNITINSISDLSGYTANIVVEYTVD